MPVSVFHSLPPSSQREILRQFANIFGVIQSYAFPSSITSYGGLTFSPTASIIAAH